MILKEDMKIYDDEGPDLGDILESVVTYGVQSIDDKQRIIYHSTVRGIFKTRAEAEARVLELGENSFGVRVYPLGEPAMDVYDFGEGQIPKE